MAYVRSRGLDVSDDGLMDSCAPDVAAFLKVLTVAKRGGTAQELPFADEKFKQMAWCLAEAAWEPHRLALAKAEVIGLFRDERKGHLLVRATAVGGDLKLHHLVLGIKTRFGTGAINVSHATRTIMQRAGSLQWARPKPSQAADPGGTGADNLFEQMCQKIRFVAIDSASDEVKGEIQRHTKQKHRCVCVCFCVFFLLCFQTEATTKNTTKHACAFVCCVFLCSLVGRVSIGHGRGQWLLHGH